MQSTRRARENADILATTNSMHTPMTTPVEAKKNGRLSTPAPMAVLVRLKTDKMRETPFTGPWLFPSAPPPPSNASLGGSESMP